MPEQVIADIVKKGCKNICEIRIDRDRKGISMFVKSEAFEEFFKSMHGSLVEAGLCGADDLVVSSNVGWRGLKAYKLTGDTSLLSETYSLERWGEPQNIMFSQDGRINLAFLRAVGLTDGIAFSFPGVYSKHQCEQFKDKLKAAIREMYSGLLKRYSCEVKFYIEEVGQ